MSFLLLCVLIAVFCYSSVNAITEIPLPHIDIFMLCSSDIGYGESLNYKKEMDGYFSDLIPSALDVVIADMDDNDNESDSDEATPKHGVEIIDCPGDNDRKQVRVTGDGMYVEMDDHSPLTEGDIKTLVKVEALKSYFSNVCNELHTFEAIISDAGSKPKTGTCSMQYNALRLNKTDSTITLLLKPPSRRSNHHSFPSSPSIFE